MSTMNFTLDSVAVIVTGAGEAAVEEINDNGGAELARVCLMVPGSIAWDDCHCGQFVQTVTTAVPMMQFPAGGGDQRRTPCGPHQVGINVIASVTRCVHGVLENGSAPVCDALGADALQLERDRYSLTVAINCFLRTQRDEMRIIDYVIGTSTAVGPEGGCAGVELAYSFGLAFNGCGCD